MRTGRTPSAAVGLKFRTERSLRFCRTHRRFPVLAHKSHGARTRVLVPRYFFHLRNDTAVVLDEEGLFLPNVEAMRGEVAQSIQEIISEPEFGQHGLCGQELEIADEYGKTVMIVPF